MRDFDSDSECLSSGSQQGPSPGKEHNDATLIDADQKLTACLRLQPTNNTLSCPPSPATVTTSAPASTGLHSSSPYFPTSTIRTGKRSHHDLTQPSQPSPKRARVQQAPSSCKSDDAARTQQPSTNSSGKSAANKRALNKAVEEGTFKRNERKWVAFKLKIMAIDPQSEVDDVNPRRARDVLHVKCGKLIRMATVYDTSLYKRHVQNCKSRTATAGMHTLDNGLNYVFRCQPGWSSSATRSSDVCDKSTTLRPCPGLSEEDEPQIETYLCRTAVSSAGGISIDTIAEQMYNNPYKNLSDDKKQIVCAEQVQTHRWSLDHQRRRVFAIGLECCFREVLHRSGRPLPCRACKALLTKRAFRTAIHRDAPDVGNRKFTPLLYQAAEIAKNSRASRVNIQKGEIQLTIPLCGILMVLLYSYRMPCMTKTAPSRARAVPRPVPVSYKVMLVTVCTLIHGWESKLGERA
jgi:hypothetical protein